MSLMSKLMSVPRHLPTGTATGRGHLMNFVVDKGERYTASFMLGAAKTYYGEKFIWKGHGADLWLGVGLTLGSALLNAWTGGRSGLADHAERLGDAGVMSALNSRGAAWGLEKAGKSVSVTPALGKKSMLGYIAPAMGGTMLTAEEMSRFSQRR